MLWDDDCAEQSTAQLNRGWCPGKTARAARGHELIVSPDHLFKPRGRAASPTLKRSLTGAARPPLQHLAEEYASLEAGKVTGCG